MLWSLLALSLLPPIAGPCPPDKAPVGAGPASFVIAQPRAGAVVVNAAQFGANPSAADNFEAFTKAFEACRKEGVGTLKIPAGTYRFESAQKPLTLSGLKDLRIDAQGATFLFSKIPVPGRLIHFSACKRIAVNGLSIDWDWRARPLAFVAEVASSNGSGGLTLRFPGEAPSGLRLDSFEMVEPKTWEPLPNGREIANPQVAVAKRTGKDTMLIRGGAQLAKLKAGQWVRLRQFSYAAHAIEIEDSEDVSFNACNIWSAPGMGYVLRGDTQRVEWLKCKIEPSGDRSLSVAADGIHVAHSKGGLRIEGCTFRNLGDDCLNIKDDISIGLRQEGPRSVVLENLKKWRNLFSVGDILELRSPDYGAPYLTPAISATEWLADDRCRVSFASDIPSLGDKTMVFNRRYGAANTIIRGNVFRGNRARGALIKAPGVLVESNLFYRTGGPAIYFELGRWGGTGDPEGTIVSGVVIKNNRFSQTNVYGWGDGVVQFDVLGLGRAPRERPFKSIRFEGNAFEAYGGHAIVARYIEGLTLRGNQFKPSASVKEGDGRVLVSDCVSVSLKCDTWNAVSPATSRGYELDRVDPKSLL